MVCSFSFVELGQTALSTGTGWITCVVLRATQLAAIRGGWSACLRRFLERQLFGPNGLASTGLPLTVGGQHILLFARMSNLLSDGDGLRQALDWRGASSLKPCFKHCNIYKKAALAHDIARGSSVHASFCLGNRAHTSCIQLLHRQPCTHTSCTQLLNTCSRKCLASGFRFGSPRTRFRGNVFPRRRCFQELVTRRVARVAGCAGRSSHHAHESHFAGVQVRGH